MNVFDRGKKRLIWRRDANKTIDRKNDPDKNYANLQKAMANFLGISRLIRTISKAPGPHDSPRSARKPGAYKQGAWGGWNKILRSKRPSRLLGA